jgi:hypothetical protein
MIRKWCHVEENLRALINVRGVIPTDRRRLNGMGGSPFDLSLFVPCMLFYILHYLMDFRGFWLYLYPPSLVAISPLPCWLVSCNQYLCFPG